MHEVNSFLHDFLSSPFGFMWDMGFVCAVLTCISSQSPSTMSLIYQRVHIKCPDGLLMFPTLIEHFCLPTYDI